MLRSFPTPKPVNVQKPTEIGKTVRIPHPFTQGTGIQVDVNDSRAASELYDPSKVEDAPEKGNGETVTDIGPVDVEEQKQEKPVEEVKPPDFSFFPLQSTSFCMDCGGQAAYMGRSTSRGFNKKICRLCCQKYLLILNGVDTANI